MKILGLIPARGGSKGIPHKNKKLLGGKPLLQYTVEAALASKRLDKIVFTSEDTELIDLAKSLGVAVPFIRPAHLSLDTSGSMGVVQHALNYFLEQGEIYDAICLLQVTTPFRTASDIDSAIEKFITEGNDALISVQKIPHQYNPHWVFEVSNKGMLTPVMGASEIIKRRQDLPEAFIRDGAIYITKTEVVLQQHSFFGKRLSYFETDADHYINIDTPEDWERAEQLYKKLYK